MAENSNKCEKWSCKWDPKNFLCVIDEQLSMGWVDFYKKANWNDYEPQIHYNTQYIYAPHKNNNAPFFNLTYPHHGAVLLMCLCCKDWLKHETENIYVLSQ